jgi:hypothetical protein
MKISSRASTGIVGAILLVACASGPWISACSSDAATVPGDGDAGLTPAPTATTPPVTCGDGVKNGSETDVDCGGSCPAACGTGKGCAAAADCSTAVCNANVCAAPSCTDLAKNGAETDVDCGGTCPNKCASAAGCAVAGDCTSGVCDTTTKKCSTVGCTDLVKNGTETDVDCGGTCPNKCADAAGCAVAADCASGICNGTTKTCTAPLCNDTVKNGTETDVDCGGTCSTKCATGKVCAAAGDCASGVCDGPTKKCVVAPTCSDGIKNGTETAIDCQGGCVATCATGMGCAAAANCASGVCTGALCVAGTCSDGVKNGAETAIDCQGGCVATCAIGMTCAGHADCASGACSAATKKCVAATCNDGLKDGAETAIDCQGGCVGTCATAMTCANAGECASGVCTATKCVAATCSDGVKNGAETAIDCQGGCVGTCSTGQACAAPANCASGVCTGGFCIAPSCSDGVKNGAETAVDCQGGCAATCVIGQACVANANCATGNCDIGGTNTCIAAPTCNDGIKNGAETAIDCQGGCVGTCIIGMGCVANANCATGNCDVGTNTCIAAPTCNDGIQNGTETAIDCQGGCVGTCALDMGCVANANCVSGVCGVGGKCVTGTYSGSDKNTFLSGNGAYGQVNGTNALSANSQNNRLTPGAMTLKVLTFTLSAADATRTFSGTVMLNGAATALTCTVAAGDPSCTIAANVAVAAGQAINIYVRRVSGPPAATATGAWKIDYTVP